MMMIITTIIIMIIIKIMFNAYIVPFTSKYDQIHISNKMIH